MAYHRNKILITIFLIILKIVFTIQQSSCFLPDGVRKSTCVRIHYCDFFQNLIRQHNGRPPQSVVQNINSHVCGAGGFVCCPDNAVMVTTTTTTSTAAPPQNPITEQNIPRTATDLNALKNHPNFRLINEKSCGLSTSTRIIGGVDADLKEFPWAVLLGYQLLDTFQWGCGGTLISKQFVVTAAHCITNDLISVRLGEHTISTPRDCDEFNSCADPVQDINIEKKIKHPLYKRSAGQRNDIAMLKLQAPADTSKNNVRTICLPVSPINDIENIKTLKRPLIITGWGKLANGQASDVLQKAFVPYVENNECANKFSPHGIQVYHTYLCAGGHNKTDTCKGDSGGGIASFSTVNDKPKTVLYGIVSGGIRCEDPKLVFPGIYTNIKYYLDWMLDNMS